MSRLTTSRRIATAARWPVGISLTLWRYLWRITPMHREEREGQLSAMAPPELPASFDRTDVQTPADGVGTMFHRIYRARIAGAHHSGPELIEAMSRDLDAFAPSEFASFQKVDRTADACTPGQEYVVRMPGPWDGPVRVVNVTDRSIRLATLRGHLEAGQIEFRVGDEDEPLTFAIESWARSASRLTDLLYARMHMSKEIQLHMWVSFLEHVIKRSGGRRAGPIEIITEHAGGGGYGR